MHSFIIEDSKFLNPLADGWLFFVANNVQIFEHILARFQYESIFVDKKSNFNNVLFVDIWLGGLVLSIHSSVKNTYC